MRKMVFSCFLGVLLQCLSWYLLSTRQKIFVMPNMDDLWLPIMHSAMDTRSNASSISEPNDALRGPEPEESEVSYIWRRRRVRRLFRHGNILTPHPRGCVVGVYAAQNDPFVANFKRLGVYCLPNVRKYWRFWHIDWIGTINLWCTASPNLSCTVSIFRTFPIVCERFVNSSGQIFAGMMRK